jgi:hypothetical protein
MVSRDSHSLSVWQISIEQDSVLNVAGNDESAVQKIFIDEMIQ